MGNKFVCAVKAALSRASFSGVASPDAQTWYDTPVIPLTDCWELYKRDTACRSSVDLIAASLVGMGFYTTAVSKEKYVEADDAKKLVDDFCKVANLDRMLNRMAKRVVACGNEFWLKISSTELIRMPLDAVEKVLLSKTQIQNIELPYKVVGYKLSAKYGGGTLKPEAVIHWKLEDDDASQGFAIGLMQTLLHTLTIQGCEKRPSYAAMKAKIETIMPGIFEKYAGPDVLANVPGANDDTIKKFEKAIKERKKEGTWLFYNGKDKNGCPNVSINPVQIDPRARFDSYIEHMVNQFYLGCQTPLARLFSTPGFTEASANAALDLQDLLIKPTQRDIKRTVEGEIFDAVLKGKFDSVQAAVRLNWGSPETPELLISDLISAAEKNLIRPDEFRKNASKAGWELWDAAPGQAAAGVGDSNQNNQVTKNGG
jgi:hypothetical protein